eukprot:gene7478-623_t
MDLDGYDTDEMELLAAPMAFSRVRVKPSPSPTPTPAAYESGDIELRFGNNQNPVRAHSQLLSLASPTVLASMINAEDPKASYLMTSPFVRY